MTSFSRKSALALIDLPSPEVAFDPILVPEKQHRFVPSPRKLIEMGLTPGDFHPVCRNWIAPCSRTVA